MILKSDCALVKAALCAQARTSLTVSWTPTATRAARRATPRRCTAARRATRCRTPGYHLCSASRWVLRCSAVCCSAPCCSAPCCSAACCVLQCSLLQCSVLCAAVLHVQATWKGEMPRCVAAAAETGRVWCEESADTACQQLCYLQGEGTHDTCRHVWTRDT